MRISIYFTPLGLTSADIAGKPVIVVDILRATTTISFLRRVIEHPDFVAGRVDTKFLERTPELLRAE